MKLFQNVRSLVAVVATLAAPATAQTVTYLKSLIGPVVIAPFTTSDEIANDVSWAPRTGDFDGVTIFSAEMAFNYRVAYTYNSLLKVGRAEAGLGGDLDLEILEVGGDVVDADFEAWAQDTSGGATGGYLAKVKLAGITVYNKTDTTSVDLSKSLSGDYSKTWLSVSKTFMIGPIPVVVKCSASSSAEFSLTAGIKPVSMSAGLTGSAKLIPGSVSASAGIGFDVGFAGASAGVAADLDFATLTLSAAFQAKASSGFSGSLSYALEAMTMTLKLYAEAYLDLIVKIKKEWDAVLVSKSWGSSSNTYSF